MGSLTYARQMLQGLEIERLVRLVQFRDRSWGFYAYASHLINIVNDFKDRLRYGRLYHRMLSNQI